MADQINAIREAIIDGRRKFVAEEVTKALEAGVDPEKLLKEAMVPAMDEVGKLFEQGEFFIPEMLVAARSMSAGMEILKPKLKENNVETLGVVVVGTAEGDLHDIGKNLVGMMLEGAGFEVHDLGPDVSPEKFIAAVKEFNAKIVAISALVTTTMPAMGRTVEAFKAAGLRDQVKIIVGGAPLSQAYADQIGADGYSVDATDAVALARKLMSA